MLRIGIEAMGHQRFAYIVAQPNDDGLIGRILPQRIPATDGRQMKKVVGRRRRRHGPLEAGVSPGIVAGIFSHPRATENIDKEDQYTRGHENNPAGCE